MTISSATLTTQRLCQEFSGPERLKLRDLFDLPRSAKIEDIVQAMKAADITIETLGWYLDVDLVPETKRTFYAQLTEQFSGREIDVIYAKLGFTRGYEPVAVRMRRIAELATTERYTLHYLRELCDTRREPA